LSLKIICGVVGEGKIKFGGSARRKSKVKVKVKHTK
jgi:hypothetical protein